MVMMHPDALLKRAGKRASLEMNVIGGSRFPSTLAKQQALERVKQAFEDAKTVIAESAVPADAPAMARPVYEARRQLMLKSVEQCVNAPMAPHIRAARMQGLREGNEAREKDIRSALEETTEKAIEILKDMAEKAEKALEFVAKLAKDPLKFYAIAEKFINRDILRAMEANGIRLVAGMSFPSTGDFLEALKRNKVTAKMLKAAGEAFEAAAHFLGVLQVGLDVVTTIFKIAADTGHWERVFLRGAADIGAGLTIGAIASSAGAEAAIGSALGGIAAAVGVTAEVPPVAIAIAAAGLVVIATWAVAEVLDSLFNALFGIGGDGAITMTATAAMTFSETSSETFSATSS